MDEPIIITVPYKNTERQFEVELQVTGYTHRFKVMVNEVPVVFEPDEEKQYRAVIYEDYDKHARSIDRELLESIADTLTKELQ